MEVDKGIKLEDSQSDDFLNSGLKVKKEYEGCVGCFELEDQIRKAKDKCAYLELEIGKKNSVIEWLEGKLGFMELKKLQVEDEVRVLKQRNQELEKSILNGRQEEEEEEHDKFTQLVIENKVLECEKNKAESEILVWKVKCKQLENRVTELENKLSAGTMQTQAGDLLLQHGFNVAGGPSAVRAESENEANQDKDASGTPPISTPSNQYADAEGFKPGRQCELKSTVRKCLDFAAEGTPSKNISPSTPGGKPLFGPIDISDSDNDLNTVQLHLSDPHYKVQKKVWSSSVGLGVNLDEKEVILNLKERHEAVVQHQSNEEAATCDTARQPYLWTPTRRKVRRGVAYIVTSESETDDNTPICRLSNKNQLTHSSDSLLRRSENGSCFRDNCKKRRRLRRVGDHEDKGVSGECSFKSTGIQNNLGIPEIINGSLSENETDEDDLRSEGESLGGFIVNSSDVSETDSGSNCNGMSENVGSFSGDCSGESENALESSMAYNEIISGFRRGRKNKLKWEYEADMLADFGKCPKLCMKAVCALYRQQTSEEKSCKATIIRNGRGFNQIHALSGSALAEFLTDGDPKGDMKKSVDELQEFNAKGVEQCRQMARHYSKQLFEIYKNQEDPFFHP